MNISGINSLGGLDFKSMKEMMLDKEKAGAIEEALNSNMIEQATVAVEKQDNGVMSRNFASAPKSEDETNYAKKTLAGKQAASAQTSRQNAVLNSAMAQMASTDSYAARNLAGKRAARSMMQEMQRTVQEESERNLKEGRNAVEAAASEAVAQGSASAADVATSVAPAPAAASVATPAPAAAATPEASDSAPAAPVAESVDVIV